MIKVHAWQKDKVLSLSVEGHAEYNPGNDIVCAGCSAIVYSLMGWVANFPAHIRNVDELYDKSGVAHIMAEGDECFAAAYDMAVVGLMQIAKKYPQNVRILIG